MKIVYDASALLDLLPERPRRKWAEPLYRHVRPRYPLLMPALIAWELAETLRRRPAPDKVDAARHRHELLERMLRSSRLEPPGPEHRRSLTRLAVEASLTAYDAAYLTIASHHPDAVLVTEDDKLLKAARRALGTRRCATARELLAALKPSNP